MRDKPKPSHPGEVLYGLFMEPVGLKSKDLAERIGVDRKTISRLINAKTSITAEMALKLAKAFNNPAYIWLGMQQNYDLAKAEKTARKQVKSIIPFDFDAATA